MQEKKVKEPVIMEGKSGGQMWRDPAKAERLRWEKPLQMCKWLLEDTARRVEESKQVFGEQFFRGDCHSHTQHSDGIGTVAETAEMARAARLDFQFVTDHWGLTQASECIEHGLWFGQEPTTATHHMLVLGLNHAFTPQPDDFLQSVADAKALGATVCVPHPTGWWPDRIYTPEQISMLESLPDPFLMEIVNGANNIVRAIDFTDESAIKLWDHLLNLGKIVYAMGNTDAHAPHGIGTIWNGVHAAHCTEDAIIHTLNSGNHFVSEAPLIGLRTAEVPMGSFVERTNVAQLQINVADSRGLEKVLLVADGKVVEKWHLDGAAQLQKQIAFPPQTQRYVRLEAMARDGKRAFSNPLFVKS